jgi:hypothetical protein
LETGQTSERIFTFSTVSAGTYGIVNVGSNHLVNSRDRSMAVLICRKIELRR